MSRLFIDLIGTTLYEEEAKLLTHPHCAGVILFARNYSNSKQLSQLVADIRGAGHKHLLVITDHEGGQVQRFKQNFTHFRWWYHS